jgi:hypothetical protein
MARVLIETQPWGVIQDTSGNALVGQSVHIANTDATAATTWSAQTGGSSTTADQSTLSNGAVPRYIDEGEYDVTVAGVTKRVEAVAGGLRGIVIKSASDDLQAALTRAGINGGVVTIADGLDYTFSTLLAVPAKVVLQLGMGTTLSCAVTGGGNAITLGAAAMIRGASGGGGGSGGAGGSRVRAVSGANISALITNAAPNQEYVYLRDLFIVAESGSTVRSLVDYVGVFFNSGIWGCVLDAATVATNCLRIRSSGTTQFGQLGFFQTWFNRAAQDCILIEGAGSTGGGSVSGRDIWFDKCIVENWGIGTDSNGDPTGGMKITAPTGVILDVVFRDGHFENGTTAGSASQLIWAKKVVGLAVEQTGVFLTTTTNYSGVVWTNNTENQGGRIINLDANASVTKLVDDQKRAYICTDTSCDFYYQGGRTNQNFTLPSLTLPTLTAASVPNSTVFVDTGGGLQFKSSTGVPKALFEAFNPASQNYLGWTHDPATQHDQQQPDGGQVLRDEGPDPGVDQRHERRPITCRRRRDADERPELRRAPDLIGGAHRHECRPNHELRCHWAEDRCAHGWSFRNHGWTVCLRLGCVPGERHDHAEVRCTGSSANPDGDAMNAGLTASTARAANQGTAQTALASIAGTVGSNLKFQLLYWAGLT